MTLLLFYWFISTMITIGIAQNVEDRFNLTDIIFSIISGWFISPIKLGKLISHLHSDFN